MALESLVTVSWFGTPELAREDLAKLQNAGLNAYLGGEYHRYGAAVELRVPESEAARALEVLGIDPAELAEESAPPVEMPACPDCGSGASRKLPPDAFRVLLLSLAFLALMLVLGKGWIGGAAMLPAWVAVIWLSRYSGRYRCSACGRDWKPE